MVKLDGAAQRVPVPTGSLTELFANVEKKVTVEEINEVMKKQQMNRMVIQKTL